TTSGDDSGLCAVPGPARTFRRGDSFCRRCVAAVCPVARRELNRIESRENQKLPLPVPAASVLLTNSVGICSTAHYIAAQKFWDMKHTPHPPYGHPLPSEGRGMGRGVRLDAVASMSRNYCAII